MTVELNSSFQAIKTITGFGPGPAGSGAPVGRRLRGTRPGARPGGTAGGSLSDVPLAPG